MLYPTFSMTNFVKLDLIRRGQPGDDGFGRPTPPVETTVTITANVQPIEKSTDTRILPEADRSKACFKVYSRGEEIRQLKEGPNGWSADRFIWEGELYEVMKVINYSMGILNHYKAICMRVERNSTA
ncbi:hypothetical protein IttPL_0064 [Pseudomonas phage ITTPL]|uniref:Head-tail joining protein n=1 Tax=Pseudomonas phage ITTPL TaxID=2544984 RepID=A0A5B7LVI4_9CAUD|nr:hypothetical protein QE324_gp063 [Pseudomonas phage ITTPL]QBP28078.1 hypothetical protein IttPL_0064 [Pseudomonas phage ITTPL]